MRRAQHSGSSFGPSSGGGFAPVMICAVMWNHRQTQSTHRGRLADCHQHMSVSLYGFVSIACCTHLLTALLLYNTARRLVGHLVPLSVLYTVLYVHTPQATVLTVSYHCMWYYTVPQCCRCLRRKTVREEFYCHDDDAMYWPGQLFHKNKDKNFKTKDGEYRDSSPRAKFWRSMETASMLLEE